MSYWLSLISNKKDAVELPLIDRDDAGVGLGFIKAGGAEWGSIDAQPMMASSYDVEGSRRKGQTIGPRTLSFPLYIIAGTGEAQTQTVLAEKYAQLQAVVRELQEYGGECKHRAAYMAAGVRYVVEHARLEGNQWSKLAELGAAIQTQLVMTVRPYALGNPMDVVDDFTLNTTGDEGIYNWGGSDWTWALGATESNMNITLGSITPVSTALTTERALLHSGTGYTVADARAQIKFTPGATISSFKAGLILRWVDSDNYLEAYVDDNGVNSRLRIDTIVGGVRTNLTSSNLSARVSNGTAGWIVASVQDDLVYADYWTSEPSWSGTATLSATTQTLTSTAKTYLGRDIEGLRGVSWIPQHADARLDDFASHAFFFRTADSGYNLRLGGSGLPGDVDALYDLRGYPPNAGWLAIIGTKRSIWNICDNGNFENHGATLSALAGWRNTAISGVTAAATSFDTSIVAGYEGAYCGEITVPATINSGGTNLLAHQFKKGTTYTASIYVRSSSNTNNVQIVLGVSGDLAVGSAHTLSTTWTKLSVTWTPTALNQFAYVGVRTTTATASTWQVDHAIVYEDTTEPSYYVGSRPLGVVQCTTPKYGGTLTASSSYGAGHYLAQAANAATVYKMFAMHTVEDSETGTHDFTWFHLPVVNTGATTPAVQTTFRDPITDRVIYALGDSISSYSRSLTDRVPSSSVGIRSKTQGTFQIPSDDGLSMVCKVEANGAGTGIGIALNESLIVPTKRAALAIVGQAATGSLSSTVHLIGSDLTARAGLRLFGTPSALYPNEGYRVSSYMMGDDLTLPVGSDGAEVIAVTHTDYTNVMDIASTSVGQAGRFAPWATHVNVSVTPRYVVAAT